MATLLRKASQVANFVKPASLYASNVRFVNFIKKGVKGPNHPPQPHPTIREAAITLPKLPIAFTGSTYDTEIKRKNPINDPNKPYIWESNKKALEWTDWRMLKDVRRRHVVSGWFPLRSNLLLVRKNKLMPKEVREDAHREVLTFPLWSSVTHVTNRCVVTSRGKGRVRDWRLSRIVWRNLADLNQLSGINKSTWGP